MLFTWNALNMRLHDTSGKCGAVYNQL